MSVTSNQQAIEDGSHELTLRDVLTSGSLLSLEQALRLGLGIIDDLERHENRGSFCRELRPEDIVLKGANQRPHVVVAASQEKRGVQSPRSGEAPSCYVSPEVALGDPPDALSNIWLVGALLFEMVSGRPLFSPHPHASSSETHLDGPVPDLREFRNDVPESLAIMIYQMLDTDRDLRLPRIELVRAELECSLGDLPPSPPPEISEEDEDLQNIPYAPTRFVGREEELARIAQLFAEGRCRLLSFIGPGGVGKSRLAFHAAERLAEQFNDGVYFVPLNPVRSAAFVPLAIGNTLRFSFLGQREPVEQLIDYLKTRQLLLVLDNFDHLIQGTDFVAELLAKTDEVRIIVTSRERLNLHQERILEVKGLPVPTDVHAEDAENYSSVQLFRDNAERICSSFSMSDAQRPHGVRICQLLGGLPLGIELASDWVRVLTCEEIAHEIERGIDFLATTEQDVPEQHRSMRAAFDRSWNLLTDVEKTVLARLSTFSGGFTREFAHDVAGASLQLLASFVDKSLLRRDVFGRFDLHELLRQYLEQHLGQSPQAAEEVRTAHARCYAALLDELTEPLSGQGQRDALGRIEREIGNIQKSWEWVVERRMMHEMGRCAQPLYAFYQMRGWFKEGDNAFRQAVTSLRATSGKGEILDGGTAAILGKVLARRGAFAYLLGQSREARKLLQESLDLFAPEEAPLDTIFVFGALADISLREGEFDESRELCERALTISREARDRRSEADMLARMGMSTVQAGRYEEARTLFEQGLTVGRESPCPQVLARCLNGLGTVAYYLGDAEEASRWYEEALAAVREVGDRSLIPVMLGNLGNTSGVLGDHQKAKQFYQESLEMRRETGDLDGIASGLYLLGHVCTTLGEFEDAERFERESIAIHRRTGSRSNLGVSLACLGNVLYLAGRYDEANDIYEESLDIFRSLNQRWGIARVHAGLGSVARARGDAMAAFDHLREALRVAVEIQAADHALSTINLWAQILRAEEQPEKATELFGFLSVHEPSPREIRNEASRFLAELSAQLSATAFEAAVARGKSHTFEEIVKELLEEE
jgi:predicted ATPase/uncharacterized protein HemY